MSDNKDLSPEEVDAEVKSVYGGMLDMNAQAINAIRRQMYNVEVVRDLYQELADRCDDLRNLLATGAAVVADNVGTLILNEFGLEKVDGSEIDEDEDEDDE